MQEKLRAVCRACGSEESEIREAEPHAGLYCKRCGKHKRWIPKEDTIQSVCKWVMPIGKWKGNTLEEIYEARPEYLEWMVKNTSTKNIRKKIQFFLDMKENL